MVCLNATGSTIPGFSIPTQIERLVYSMLLLLSCRSTFRMFQHRSLNDTTNSRETLKVEMQQTLNECQPAQCLLVRHRGCPSQTWKRTLESIIETIFEQGENPTWQQQPQQRLQPGSGQIYKRANPDHHHRRVVQMGRQLHCCRTDIKPSQLVGLRATTTGWGSLHMEVLLRNCTNPYWKKMRNWTNFTNLQVGILWLFCKTRKRTEINRKIGWRIFKSRSVS